MGIRARASARAKASSSSAACGSRPPTCRYVAAVTAIEAPLKCGCAAPGRARSRRGQPGGAASRDAVLEVLDHDLAADGPGPALGGLQQRRQPAGLDLGVGVRGGHEAVRRAGLQQPLAGDVHAQPARGADAQRRALDDVQAQVARRLHRALARRVGAAVEDEDDLIGVARDPALRGQRLHAAPDERLLVAGGDRDHGEQRAHAPSSRLRRAAS